MSRLLITLLAALALTACGDCPPDDVAAVTASVTTPTPAPVQTPAPAPVAAPAPAPTPAPTTPEPITACPQSTNVVCAPSPTPLPVRPIVIVPPIAADDYGDCRCDQAGNLTCTNPNPPPYIFCPPTPRPNPAACVYECNNDSGPVSY